MHGHISGLHRRRQSSQRHFHGSQRAAAIRALTAARLYLGGQVATLEAAAVSCGSKHVYVAAMIILIQAENSAVLMAVLGGNVSVVTAAKQLKPQVDLITAFRKSSASDHAALGRVAGPGRIWDEVIVPTLS